MKTITANIKEGIDQEIITEAGSILKDGGLVAFPTETVYGLGGNALDEQAAEECRRVLSSFFAEMTEWEQYMEQAGFEDAEAVPRLLAIWEKYVSEKPRPGFRPLGLSYSAQGTYKGEQFLDAEQITRNKLYIYTRKKNTGFDRRFLMKCVGEGWRIDAVQERLDGWQRVGL